MGRTTYVSFLLRPPPPKNSLAAVSLVQNSSERRAHRSEKSCSRRALQCSPSSATAERSWLEEEEEAEIKG